jgi:putative PIN family toxin of toxin-antitoxin system
MSPPLQAVYDCNVLVQALISNRGPAYAAVEAAGDGRVGLFHSPHVVDELRRVAARPSLAIRFSLTEKRVDDFVELLGRCSHCMTAVPHVFDLARDPDDAHYVDLAIAAKAQLIVSRDRDLISLSDLTRPEGQEFALRFPNLQVVTLPQLLSLISLENEK